MLEREDWGGGGCDGITVGQARDKWRAHVKAVPLNAGKLSSGFTTDDLSSSAQFHRVSQLVS
jgi:hypothetical protein